MTAEISYSITERGAVPRADWAPAMKLAWGDTGRFWHRDLRPKHFTHSGAKEYGYEPRAGERGRQKSGGRRAFLQSYTGRKLKQFGHTRPLEFTGQSKSLTQVRVIKTTSKGVKVDMRAARGFNRRNPLSPIRMWDELTTISEGEKPELQQRQARNLGDRLNRLRHQRKTVIK